jgi:7-cyano-7-deazaguanine synthase
MAIAGVAGVIEHRLVSLPDLREAADIPGFTLGSLPPTYIPLRNSIFYAFAASMAEETGAVSIVGGHNRDDTKVFSDVSSDFFKAQEAAFRAASPILRRNRVRIVRPLRLKSKAEVVALAGRLKVPLEVTWSCHRDGTEHCWRCPGCVSRREAFERADMVDPLALAREKIT